MVIVNEPLLDVFRRAGKCCWCKRSGPTDPHHVSAKGMSNSKRLDCSINLASLCRRCHTELHAGHIERFSLLAIVAQREGTRQDYIEEAVFVLNRIPKHPTGKDVAKELARVKRETADLVLRSLFEAGVLVVAA